MAGGDTAVAYTWEQEVTEKNLAEKRKVLARIVYRGTLTRRGLLPIFSSIEWFQERPLMVDIRGHWETTYTDTLITTRVLQQRGSTITDVPPVTVTDPAIYDAFALFPIAYALHRSPTERVPVRVFTVLGGIKTYWFEPLGLGEEGEGNDAIRGNRIRVRMDQPNELPETFIFDERSGALIGYRHGTEKPIGTATEEVRRQLTPR